MSEIRVFFPVNALSYFAEHPMVWLRWDSLGVTPSMTVVEVRRALARPNAGPNASWVPDARLFRVIDGVEATEGVLSDEARLGYVAVSAAEALPAFVRGLRLRFRNEFMAGEPTAEEWSPDPSAGRPGVRCGGRPTLLRRRARGRQDRADDRARSPLRSRRGPPQPSRRSAA